MADPKCPDCKISGTKHITSTHSDQKTSNGYSYFHIAHCSECGHIHGIYTKTIPAPYNPPHISFP